MRGSKVRVLQDPILLTLKLSFSYIAAKEPLAKTQVVYFVDICFSSSLMNPAFGDGEALGDGGYGGKFKKIPVGRSTTGMQ